MNLGSNRDHIEPDTADKIFATLRAYKERNDEVGVEKTRLVGTDILRTADNALKFTERVEKLFGVPVEVISHEREGYYLYRGLRDVVPEGTIFGAINCGGGSIEIVIGDTSELIDNILIQFGVNALRKQFGSKDDPNTVDWNGLETYLEQEMNVGRTTLDYFFLSGVYDFLNIAGRAIGFEYDSCDIRDHPIKTDTPTYSQHADVIKRTAIETLRDAYPKNPKYADNFAIGEMVYYTAVKKLGVEEVIPSPYEYTDGLIAEMIE